MKSWKRALMIAFWLTLITVVLLAVFGITTIPIANSGFFIAGLIAFSVAAQFESFMLLNHIEPNLRTLRNDLVINIIISLLLMVAIFYLSIVLPLPSGSLKIWEFTIVLFLFLALLFALLITSLYFVVRKKRNSNCD